MMHIAYSLYFPKITNSPISKKIINFPPIFVKFKFLAYFRFFASSLFWPWCIYALMFYTYWMPLIWLLFCNWNNVEYIRDYVVSSIATLYSLVDYVQWSCCFSCWNGNCLTCKNVSHCLCLDVARTKLWKHCHESVSQFSTNAMQWHEPRNWASIWYHCLNNCCFVKNL